MNKGNLRNGILFTLIATLLCCVLAVFCAWGIGGNTRNAAFADTSAAEAEEATGAETGEENISTVAGETADGDDISTYTYVLNGTNNATTWNNAINDSVNNKRRVKVLLAADWTATANSSNGFGSGTGFTGGRLYLPATADIVLNLQTYTLNRNITQSSYSSGNVIYMGQLSTLTVRGTTGRITGGYTTGAGGGIEASSYATINLEGGNITGNKSASYGGVYMSSYCNFTMTGGSISNNESNSSVGGIFLNSYCSFTMTGGSISNNTSKSGETGGLRVDSGNIRLEGEAQIFGNTAHTYAGGVFANNSIFYMGGNAKVYNNVATMYAGGIYCNNKITIEGNAQVYNNVAGQNGGGVWWQSSHPFDIGGNAKIYGNSCGVGYEGGGIYSNASNMTPYYVVLGGEDLEIYENYRGGDKSDRTDIFLKGGNRIKFNIKLKTEKKIYIKLADSQGSFTENYDACYSATDPNTVFVSEDDSLTLSKIDNEAYLGLEGDAWSQAIAQSISTGKEVTYTVNSTWTAATDSTFTTSFGSTTNDALGMGPYYRGALCIPWGANIRLVLNANINRNLSSAVANGMVIYVCGGTLTIEGTGSITGGYSTGSGGGIVVTGSGVLNFKSGKITGNKTTGSGGGIYYASGELNISGGEISNNYCADGGSATTAGVGGGVYATAGKFNVSGNPKIINNYRISSSTANKDNILVQNNYKINIVAPLVSGASMGISPHSGVKILTDGYKTHHPSTSATAYFSADSYYTLIKLTTNSCNELALTGGVIPNWATAVLNSLASGGAQQTCTISQNYTASSSAPLNIYTTAFGLGQSVYGAYYYGRLNVPSGASVKLNFTSSYHINRALSSSTARSDGQVIYISGGSLEISGSNGTIKGGWNTSLYGGGIYVSNGTLIMNAGTISGNYCSYPSATSNTNRYGGGVYLNTGTFTMNGGTISGNYSGRGGGVYLNTGTFNFYGGNITSNYSCYNSTYYATPQYGYGGGVYWNSGTFNVKGSGIIINNNNYYANGSTPNYSVNNSNLYISNINLNINIVGSFTGTINTYVNYSNRLFTSGAGANGVTSTSRFPFDSTANGNCSYNSTAKEFQVGTVASADAWTNLVYGSINSSTPKTYTLSSNWVPTSGTSLGTAAGYINGAIKIPANANVIIDLNGYYIDRKADSSVIGYGYAIFIEANAKVQIIDSSGKKGKIKSGHTSSAGGSIYAYGANISLTLDGVTLTGNVSTNAGGGLYFSSNGGTLNIKNSVITDNKVLSSSGGGVYIGGDADTEVNLENSVISNNKVTGLTYYGGGICLAGGTLNMTGGEISGNSSIYTGGGVWLNSSTNAKFYMRGGKITGNSAGHMGGGVYLAGVSGVFGIGGEIDISGNTLFNGTSNNIGLFSQKNGLGVVNNAKVTLLDKVVTEERIGIASWDIDMQARLTIGFTDVYGNSMAPSKVFKLDNAVGVLALSEDGEVCIRVGDQWLIAVQESLLEPGVQKTITLSGDWMANVGIFGYDETAYTANGAILVPTGVDIVLDLAGWTISRGLEALTEGGAVFYIQDGATLTIIDSSSGKTGTISGGFNNGNGGAFNVAAGGTLKLKGGNVTENTASGHGAGIYFEDGAQLTVGGSAHVYGNVNGDGDASNLYIGAGQTVLVDGKFEENALIYVTLGTTNGLGAFTSGYGDSNVDDEGEYIKPYISFASDAGKAVALSGASTGSEVELYDDAWLAAVQKSLQTGDEVEYNLTGEWRGETGAFFSKTSRDEGTAYLNGALYIPLGAKIVINAGANTITRALGTAAANGSVFVVEGVLTLNGGTVTGGNSSGNGGGFVVNDGTLNLSGAVSVADNTAVEFGGGAYIDSDKFYVEGGISITDNKVGENSNNIYLANNNVINLSGKIEGASLSVTMQATGTFTGGWNDYYNLENDVPSDYFISDMGMTIAIKDGETEVRMGVMRPTWIVTDGEGNTTYPYTINTPYNGKDYTQYATIPVAGVEKWEYSTTIGNNYGRNDDRIWVGGRAAAEYSITFTLAKNYGWFDYEGTTFKLVWNIDAVVVDVEWTFGDEWRLDSEVTNGHVREYDGNGYPLTVKVSSTSGDVSIDESEYEIRYSKVGSSADSSLTAPRDAGSYYAYVNIKTNTNFRVESTSQADFRITPRVLTLTWYAEDGQAADSNTSVTYEYAAAPHVVTAELAAKVAASGILEGDTVNAIIEYYSESTKVDAVREVGVYRAVSNKLDNQNYVLDVEYECIINVIAYKLTLDWINETPGSWEGSGDSYTWEYNGRAVNLSVDAELFDGDTLVGIGLGNVTYELLGEGDESTLVATPTDIGRYKATVAIAGEHKNYDIQNAVMYFEITPKTIVISWKWATAADNELSEVTEDGNIMLRYDGTSNHTPNAYIHDDNVLNVFYNGSLLNKLNVKAVDENGNDVDPMGSLVETKKVFAVLAKDDAANYPASFYKNFVIDVDTGSQIFEIGRFVIPDAAIVWTDSNGDNYQFDGTPTFDQLPQYKWGTVSGTEGPGFSAHAEVSLGIVGYEFNHTANRYEDAKGNIITEENYGKVWPVDQNRGYKAIIKLTEEEYKLFEFANGTDEASITFYVMSITAEKEEITVIWLVKFNNTYYKIDEHGLLVEFTGTVAENSLPDAGKVEVADGKFAFTYNGAAQSPVAVYDKNGEYALLDMVAGTRATNVGDYTASLKASNVFEYNEGGMECEYSIKPLEVNVEWTGNTAESHLLNKFEWTYDGKEHKPLATAVSAVDGIELTVSSADITVSGAINAGTHTANAKLSGNFVIAEGATKQFTINKLKLGDGTVRWSAEDMKSDTPANPRDDYFWWYFDGNEHLPTPTASFTMLDGTTITLDLIVSGATKQVGTHYAYAVLDSTKLINNNFELGESKCMFIIHRILISNVTWTNSDEDSDDVTVEIEGKELLAFVYNGKEQAPRAYYLGDDGSRVYLDVSGAMTNVNVYTARIVSNELDFAEDLETTCNYAIVPRPVEISWSGDENLVYNGQIQYLTVTLTGEAEGETLVSGTDYVVTGFANAGTHNAVITFLNANYTYNDSNSHEFTIAKFDLGGIVKWTAEAEDGDKLTIDGEDISWQYNAKSHNPVLDEIETQTDADKLFINGVEFTFSYTGAASAVGVHTARATLLSAVAGSVDVTDNFTVTTTKQFNITEYVIEVLWSGNDDVDDDNYGKLVWTYDGKAHAPTASYVDWTGATVNFEQVNGARVDAGPSYVASVQAPLNCVFSDEEGKGGEISFVINKAPITVVWKYENNGDVIADGEEAEWEYDGNAHAPEAYVSDEKLVVMGARTDAGVGYVASTTYGNPNYVLTNDRIQFNITARQVYIKWIGNPDNAGDADKEFTWVYPSGADKFVSPTAVLVDGEGNEILGSDNEPIEVTVRGAANSVGPFVAYAIDTFNNYDFADENNTWHTFTVIARKLQASDLQWIANGAIGDESGYDESLGAYVFTYTFNGKPQFPNIKVDDESFTYRIVSVKNADTSEAVPNNELPAIPGNWEVKFAPANSNYELPEEYAVTRIVILRKTVNVSWSGDKYVYNGGNQRPDAWFEDVDGKTVILEVTVDKSSYSAAGKYVATAALTSDYYALANETQVKNYEITRKQIGLVWDSANASWVYDGQQHVVTATATMNDVVKDDLSKITIEYKITGANLTNPVVNGKVTNVGVYTAEAYLSGTAKDNYEIDKPKQEFSITRAPLSVKANDILTGVEYGDKAPVYTATFNGFVNGETEESLRIVVGGAPRGGWITSNYTSTSLPGEYSIVINGTTLAMLLPNYELEIGENGLLIVNAKEAYVIWVGQDNTKDFVYDGTEHKPTAYCYVNGDKVDLTVKYANYANGVYTEITEADYKAINAGDYYAIATGNTAGAVLQNAQTGYSIKQRSVVVNIGGNDGSVYTSVYGEEVKEVSYTYAESPLPADVSKFVIGFDINFVTDDGGFVVVNTNGYTIKGKWSAADPDEQATLANNYAVTFVGEREASDGSNSLGIYYVTQATVQVTNEKHSPDGKNYYDDWHEYDPLATRFFISLADKDNGKYKNVQFSGYQDAEVKIYYGGANSPENAPLPEDDTTYVLNNSPALTSEGQYVINYKIEIPNHETLYGAWTVIITPASEVIAIEFTKTLEVDFGNGVPEDLLGVLLGDYVVNSSVGMIVGEYMTVYHVTADEFLSHATARVQFGSEAVTAATNVGNYDVFIDVESTTENVNRVVRYHADVVGEDTNLGKYAVVPRLLTVDWGETGFEYEEGVTHTPAPVVSGWVNAEPFTVEGIQTSADGSIVYTTLGLTDAGVEISIKVGVNNDFTSVGGHNVTLAVESGNYRIAPENAYGTYSIKGVVNVPGPGGDTPPIVVEGSGIPNWMMYTILGGLGLLVLLVIIAMFVRRGVTVMGDADGFNEYYREDDQDEQDDD